MGTKFKWAGAIGFLAIYGIAVFLGTRAYYTAQPQPTAAANPALPTNHPAVSSALRPFPLEPLGNDLASVMDKANAAFEGKDYKTAAVGYARALQLAPDNAVVYNDLGLTLFYLGRPDEAVKKLNAGVGVDPGFQRIWLTLGFVQSQAGRAQEARDALQKAIALDSANEIGQEARRMLDQLPR